MHSRGEASEVTKERCGARPSKEVTSSPGHIGVEPLGLGRVGAESGRACVGEATARADWGTGATWGRLGTERLDVRR